MTQSFTAEAVDIDVLAGAAFAPALSALGPRFERETGVRLNIHYGITGQIKQALDRGQAFDLVIMDAELLNYAGKLGRIASETRVEIARVGMAVATRAGGLKPDISTLAAFRQMLVDAKSITYPPEGFIGIHLSKVIDQLGIAEQVKSKTIPQETITNVPLAVAGGEAEFGFGPKTVLASASGIEMVDLFPTEIQKYIVYTAAISSAASQSNAAIGFVKYLLSPDASALLKAKGFEPIE